MKTIIRDALILFAITAVAGVLLAVVNEATKDPIAAQKQAAVEAACREVFPEASAFEEREIVSDMKATSYAQLQQKSPKNSVDRIYEAKGSDGECLGYVLNLTNREGYGGNIRFSMGIASDGTVTGLSILETGETPGLGLQAESVLLPQFSGRKAERFQYVKGGGASADNEVDAISSATITTNAFVNGVNFGLEFFREVIGEGTF